MYDGDRTGLVAAVYLCVNSTIPGLGGREFRRPTTLENSCIIVAHIILYIVQYIRSHGENDDDDNNNNNNTVLQDDGWRENEK